MPIRFRMRMPSPRAVAMLVAAMILGGAAIILFELDNPLWDAAAAGVLATFAVVVVIYLIF